MAAVAAVAFMVAAVLAAVVAIRCFASVVANHS